MFFHRKELMYDVKVQGADPRFGEMLLEQFGGATGELSAALTYWTQSFHVEDLAIRDMLHDIALEEFSHLEMVGRMIEQHTEKSDSRDAAYKSTLFAVRGVGPQSCPRRPRSKRSTPPPRRPAAIPGAAALRRSRRARRGEG